VKVSPGKRVTVLGGLLVCVALLLGGCGLISGLQDTEDALTAAGFVDPSVHVHTSGDRDSVEVRVTHPIFSTDATPVRAAAARAVWDVFPWRFEVLYVELRAVDPSPGVAYPYAALQSRFGPRPPRLDRHTYHHELRHVVVIAVVAVGAAGLVFVTTVVVVIVLVVRHNRRRRAAAVPAWGQPQWGQPQWGQWSPSPPPGAWTPPRDPPVS